MYSQLLALDKEKSVLEAQKLYFQSLREYLDNNDLTRIPSPSIVGITDPLIVENTKRLTELAIQREQMKQIMNPNSVVLRELDDQIENLKEVLAGSTRSALANLNRQLSYLNSKISALEAKLNRLPSELKRFIDLKREYEIKDQIYSYLLQKRSEVNIVKASNQSTLKILDEAKYTGQAPISPKRKITYITALLLALFFPTLFLVVKFFTDDTIHDETQVKRITPVKILGTIFHYEGKDAMPVLHEPVGSRMREAFNILRTNIRLMLPAKKGEAKTVLVTSTMSGEGKTFISSNLAAINAMSKQKTVLLEFDIRKPKSYEYFKMSKDTEGLVDFIENKNLTVDDVIRSTGIENLDIILAGRDAPSFSKEIAGLLEDKRVEELMNELKKRYNYIIIDTPPIGLVPDTLILNQFADLMLYVVREGMSRRSYLYILNEYLQNNIIKNVGIVYNNYKLDIVKKYGYQSKYSYAYAKEGYKIYSAGKRNIPGTLRRKLKHLIKGLWKRK
ncbi:MAG: polysaccharide biosynthesis tyrosine autokinase [Chlorobi bacterium]|nr:polysaccharide biosynthesis tyrosine autokinase [Chlorobiota bacterium]